MTTPPPYGPWAIARLRDGAELDSLALDRLSADAAEFAGICRYLNGGDRREAFDVWTRSHPRGETILRDVFAIPRGMVDYPEPEEDAHGDLLLVDVASLTTPASLTAAMERAATDTGEYLAAYVDYVRQIANTMPAEMNVAAALCLVSIAVARRVYFPTYFEPQVFPNLWVLIVAESTVWHKTTALNAARRLARSHMAHLLLPEESSADRLIQELAGMDPANYNQLTMFDQERWRRSKMFAAQRGLVIDEASSLFGSFQKDYNIGKVETLLKCFDCDEERVHTTVRHGNLYLRWLHMSLLGATTPAAIQKAASLQMWQMGFWPRFAVLVPERLFPDKLVHPEDDIHRPALLDNTLQQLVNRLPQPKPDSFEDRARPPEALAVTFDRAAWDHWRAYSDCMLYDLQHPDVTNDDRLRKMYGRLPVGLLKVATLLATLDWSTDDQGRKAPHVAISHYARAHQIVEGWRLNAARFIAVMDKPLAGEDHEQRLLRAIRDLTQKGPAATTRNLYHWLHWERVKVTGMLEDLRRDGLIEETESEGRRTKVWRVVEGAKL